VRAVARPFDVLRGPTPIVFVAPHGGRRDPVRHPWTRGGLRTNDLGTAELTRELAIATAGSALVNHGLDRNDVDLNRLTPAHDRAPAFLEALAELLEIAIARSGRAVVLTIHGWNVVQAIVDVGIGYRPGRHAPAAPPGPTASPEFVAGALDPFADALAARGITAALGARYPARDGENLLQLLTARHVDDRRPLVRRLAELGQRCDGMQLELGLPLRLPGPWRRHFLATLVGALPAMLHPRARCSRPRAVAEPATVRATTVEFVAGPLAGLAALDRAGGRLLLFDPDGSLALFTGERLGGERDGQVGALDIHPTTEGEMRMGYAGPLLRFPDTMPFVDLEHGLARATLVEASVAIDLRRLHPGCPFATLTGTLTLGTARRVLQGSAVLGADDPRSNSAARVALALGGEEHLLVRTRPGGATEGFLCRTGTHTAVTAGTLAPDAVCVTLATGERRTVALAPLHRLPVVRGGTVPPVQIEFTTHRLAAATDPAGWRVDRLSPPASPAA
jgi:hypothetical protein